jgi:hypothetical protein
MTSPKDTDQSEDLPYAQVWHFKHVYDGGYALMSVQKLKDRYEGALNIGGQNR